MTVARRPSSKKTDRRSNEIDQDEQFAHIAGITDGGFPYGITWEQQAVIETSEALSGSKMPVKQLRPVSLAELAQEMEVVMDEITIYFQRSTCEFISITDDHMFSAESGDSCDDRPEWEQEIIQLCGEILKDDDDFVALPSRFDIHEYAIMEEFCCTQKEPKQRHALLRAISGKGAFRKFKELIRQHALEEAWFKFKEKAYKSIAQVWCKDHNIIWTDLTSTGLSNN